MSRSEIETHSIKVKAAHRYDIVDVVRQAHVAGTRYHFIGIGGVGMSGLAQFLIEKHAIVTGSDQAATATTSRLAELGAKVHIGHAAEHLDAATAAVVVSAAVQPDNPELQRAQQQGCRIYKYAQLLGELMSYFDSIAVAGTHGKSTTSGWLVHCLQEAGVAPNFVVGANISQREASAGIGGSEFFVAEACEYDRSFLSLRPQLACILNIESDHLDCYRDEADIVDAFYQFALGSRPGGLVVANGQDRNVAQVIERLGNERDVVTFGFDAHCDCFARNVRLHHGLYHFDVCQDERCLGRTSISLPGRHNILNALAVVAVAVRIGVDPKTILEVLNRFTGMERRLMFKAKHRGVTILDDYAHHPTEIRASLKAIRQRYRPKRLWCVYQAHQYSRTRFFLDDFAASFALADKAIIPDIYFVRDSELSRSEVNAQILTDRIRAEGTDAEYAGSFDTVCDRLEKELCAGDLVVTMGAGDVWKVADECIHRLRTNR